MPTLFIRPRFGLSNRLMALISAIRVAKVASLDLRVIWDKDDHCNADLSCLFSDAFQECTLQEVPDAAVRLPPEDHKGLFFIDVGVLETGRDILITEYHFFFLQTDSWLYAKNRGFLAWEFSKLFSEFAINKYVVESVAEFSNRFTPTIGIHVRRVVITEMDSDIVQKRWNIPTDEEYAAVINVAAQIRKIDRKIYLATNSSSTRVRLKEIFGENIFFHEHPNTEQNGGNRSIQDAFVEILCLARCGVIIRRSPSTFAFLASVIGLKDSCVIYKPDDQLDVEGSKCYVAFRGLLQY